LLNIYKEQMLNTIVCLPTGEEKWGTGIKETTGLGRGLRSKVLKASVPSPALQINNVTK
jgi:hypothetical protein